MLATHWEAVYRSRDPHTVSWYQPVPALSLDLLGRVTTPADAIVDVGAGASTLADHLLDRGYTSLTLLDIAPAALDIVRRRLGPDAAASVSFVAEDLRTWTPARRFDAWHDRAVFHFLTDPDERDAYAQKLASSLRPGGHAMISAFRLGGPAQCSGLPTARYDARRLHDALGGPAVFELVEAHQEQHPHPRGGTQDFQVVLLRRR